MSDEDLRSLERTAREKPRDAAAGWAYATALERAGRRTEMFSELSRLGRLGDDAAALRLERWAPEARTGGSAGGRASSRRGPSAVRGAWRAEWAISHHREPPVQVVAASDEIGVLIGGLETPAVGFSFAEGARLWDSTVPARLGRRLGDDLVVATKTHLALIDARTGQVLGETAFPSESLACSGDRILAASREELVCFEGGGSFGRMAWRRRLEGRYRWWTVSANATHAFLQRHGEGNADGDIDAFTLEDGSSGSLDASGRDFGASPRGVVSCTRSSAQEKDAEGGQLWKVPGHFWVHTVGRGTVILSADLGHGTIELVAVDRAQGALAWRSVFGPVLAGMLSDDHVYVVFPGPRRRPYLAAHDRATGERLSGHECEVDPWMSLNSLHLAPLERALVVVAVAAGKAMIYRLEEP
jgi:hypothetical protein